MLPESDPDDGDWDGSSIGSDAGSAASECDGVESGGGNCAAGGAGARKSARVITRTPAGPGFELSQAGSIGHGQGPGEASHSPTATTAAASGLGSTAVQQQELQIDPTPSGPSKTKKLNAKKGAPKPPAAKKKRAAKKKGKAANGEKKKLSVGQRIQQGLIPLFRESV